MNISALELSQLLLDNRTWIFTPNTPNIKKISSGDKVVLYIAGRNRRYFCADFSISGPIVDIKLQGKDERERFVFNLFNLSCSIKDINLWKENLPIKDIKQDLEFIIDQKNWGLFFRQATKIIGEKDYNLIINKSKDMKK